MWWTKVKIHLKSTIYKDVMVKTWTAKDSDENRGFTEQTTLGSKAYTANEVSTLVGDMLETILTLVPEVTQTAVLGKATSLQWMYDYLRKHYGCERTGSDMLNRFETLERKPGEKMSSYWSRFMGFYEENRIKKDDKLTLDGAKAVADETQCRFSKSAELSLFLHMAHPQLPKRMAQIFGNKLKDKDLASLQEQILDRCQSVLDELEGSHTTVKRMNYNTRGYHPPDRWQNQRPNQRPGGAMQRYQTPSPTRAPKHPDNYCFLCVRDRKPDASTHFLRQCPQLPQKERDLWTRVFDKTLQTRDQPRSTWPEKIEGQTVSISLMNMVEDFYNLDPVQNGEDQLPDYFGEETEHGLPEDYIQQYKSTQNIFSYIYLMYVKNNVYYFYPVQIRLKTCSNV